MSVRAALLWLPVATLSLARMASAAVGVAAHAVAVVALARRGVRRAHRPLRQPLASRASAVVQRARRLNSMRLRPTQVANQGPVSRVASAAVARVEVAAITGSATRSVRSHRRLSPHSRRSAMIAAGSVRAGVVRAMIVAGSALSSAMIAAVSAPSSSVTIVATSAMIVAGSVRVAGRARVVVAIAIR